MKNSKQIWLITAFILYSPLCLIAQSSIGILPSSQVVSGTAGTLIPLEIKIGDPDAVLSPDNFYGIAFDLNWDNTEYIEYSNLHSAGSWLGPNPLVFIMPSSNNIEAGLSRTVHPGETGNGIVLFCSLKVKEAPLNDITANLTLSNITAVQEDGSPLNLIPTGPSTVTLIGITPVELSSFTAKAINNTIKLAWQTETEVNNYGFDVERLVEDKDWEKIGFVDGHGNSNSQKFYSFIDANLFGGNKFKYRLKQIDVSGAYEYSNIVEVNVDLTTKEYVLYQNYPNPFNPITNIYYELPIEGSVELTVYDVLGNEVFRISEDKSAGYHKVEFDGGEFTTGIYFYKLQTNNFIETKKMILLK